MPSFKYKAVTPDGATITGVEKADTITAARNALTLRDLQPV